MRTSRRPVVVHMALLFALSLLVGSAAVLAGPSDAGAATRKITIKVQYEAPSCPSGKESMQPLPGAKLLVKFGSRTIKEQLDDRGVASLNLKGKAKELTAKVVLDGDLLAVSPYGKQAPYSYVDDLKLTDKKTYGLKIKELEKAGAASAWAILSGGAKLGKASAPAGVDLGKIVARYDSGRGPTAGLPDLPGTETAYDGDKSEIVIDSRTRADEFEPWVLNHEYGHHVLEKVATPGPSGAGAHDLERSYPSQPALPWSEGFAHAFAAIVAKNPVLGTLCRTGVNIGSSPATPASQDDPWLNQYHEISVAGALWGLATQLGGGNQHAGLKRLLAALKAFHAKYGGPKSTREARDALIEGGLETTAAEHLAITQQFAAQKIGWGVTLQGATGTGGGGGSQELHLLLEGPYGTCKVTEDMSPQNDAGVQLTGMAPREPTSWQPGEVGSEGGLPYTSRDDCLVVGGDGNLDADGYHGSTLTELMLLFPYLPDQGHTNGPYTLSATWLCQDAGDEPPYTCNDDASHLFNLATGGRRALTVSGGYGGPGDDLAWTLSSDVSLGRNVATPLVRFEASGECTWLPTGEDCGF